MAGRSYLEEYGLVATPRLEKLLQIIGILVKRHRTIKSLAAEFETNERTIYRWLHLIQRLTWLELEKDFEKRYFIIVTTNSCPLCGRKHISTQRIAPSSPFTWKVFENGMEVAHV